MKFRGSENQGRRELSTCGPLRRLLALASAMACFVFRISPSSAGEPAPSAEASAGTAQTPHWSSLPFMSEEALKRGYELPLPFGVSVIYNYIQRDIKVDDLRLAPQGASPQSVSRFVDLGSNSHVDVGLARIDTWLLPFVNVYGLFGYVRNESLTHGTVTLPIPGPGPGSQTFNFSGKSMLDGFVGGGGITLAGGYREFFVMADVNFTQTDMGFDDRFHALVASARTGWNGKIADVPTRLWLGVMYWDTANTAKATVEVPGRGSVSFEADQGPLHPWNASVGTSVAFSKHFECFAEYGFNLDDVQMVAAGLTFRF
jgi:hypothetical protein